MPRLKYSKELLEPIVKESFSVMEVIRRLGFRVHAGGTHSHVTKKIRSYNIDTSHFLGQAINRGKTFTIQRRSADSLLVLRENTYRQHHPLLTRALLEIGREYKCYLCEIDSWQGEELILEIEHKNGNPLDDRRGNIEFICPNCHSQTLTYCRKKPKWRN